MSDELPEGPASHPETLALTISPAITFRGAKYDVLNLHEPPAGIVRKAEGQMRNNLSNEGLRLYNIHLIAMVSEWPVPVVELLPIRKFDEAARYLAGFIDAGPQIGGT